MHGDVHRHLADRDGRVHGDDQPCVRVLGRLLEHLCSAAGVHGVLSRHLRDGLVDLWRGEDLLVLYRGH